MVCITDALCLDSGDLVTALGIILTFGLALASFIRTKTLHKDQVTLGQEQNRLAEEQNSLLAEQNEIAKRQFEHRPPAASTHSYLAPSLRNAEFRVSLTPASRSQRLVIRNVGNASAHNVQLFLDPERGLIGGSGQDFPRIDPGQDWRLHFSRTMGSPDRYQWRLTWTEAPDGQQHDQTGWLSPP
jgi:hypothetical protein